MRDEGAEAAAGGEGKVGAFVAAHYEGEGLLLLCIWWIGDARSGLANVEVQRWFTKEEGECDGCES